MALKPAETSPAAPGEFDRSRCPIACVLDVLGDKWTLLVVRDLIFGKKRFQDFLESPEGIPTNILSNRLKRLETQAILKREFYQDHPPRAHYLLTDKGRELVEVLRPMEKWANKHIPGTIVPDSVRNADSKTA